MVQRDVLHLPSLGLDKDLPFRTCPWLFTISWGLWLHTTCGQSQLLGMLMEGQMEGSYIPRNVMLVHSS